MKRILVVTLLIMSFASVALADGSGQRPPAVTGVLADGPGTRPPGAAAVLADGPGTRPPGTTATSIAV
jgi:hypothetical protein